MSKRKFFIPIQNGNCFFEEKFVDFVFFTGFALSQKQKSIASMHEAIKKLNVDYAPLEVSTKSPDPIGYALSAFVLQYYHSVEKKFFAVENVFQSSKVFEGNNRFAELLFVTPREAKKDERLKTSGKIIKFHCANEDWDVEPKTMFYDWIYINALAKDEKLAKEVLQYNAFTDIEFNHEKSINCQARAVAIFVSLYKNGILNDCLTNKDKFREIYKKKHQFVQMSLFDMAD